MDVLQWLHVTWLVCTGPGDSPRGPETRVYLSTPLVPTQYLPTPLPHTGANCREDETQARLRQN
jgi:hypothetical protein